MCQEISKPAVHLEKAKTQTATSKTSPSGGKSKKKMSCSQRISIRLNSLESIWYCILVTVITVFLLGDALHQYRHYKNLDWPDQPPRGELGLYGLLIFSAFALILLFIPTQIFKVGNRANDQDKLGIIKARSGESGDGNDGFRRASVNPSHLKTVRQYLYKVRGISKHMGPIGATLHIVSAFCLLLPLMFLQAKAIENGLLPVGMIWKSEVAVISPPASVYESETAHLPNQGDLVTHQSAAPVHSGLGYSRDPFRVFMVTINYLNYLVPLFFYAIRYAEVFWVSHKGFAFLFSAQLMMNAIHYALGFIGMSIMYKLSTYVHGPFNLMESPPGIAPPSLLILAFLSMNITIFLSAVTFYLFGYTRYKISEREVILPEMNGSKGKNSRGPCILRFNGLLPHIGAFVVFVILVLCKGFFIVEYSIIQSWLREPDGRIMCCILFDILYLVVWFIVWVMFTIKVKWNFGFFRHPVPHVNMDEEAQSDYTGQKSSNSDLEMNSDISKLNHLHGSQPSTNRQTSEESETSFRNNDASTSLLGPDRSLDRRNKGLVEDEADGTENFIKYADEESSGIVNSTPKKDRGIEGEVVIASPGEANKNDLMVEESTEDDSPTMFSPMLPVST